MTDFADVEEFAREHSACGGITPSAAVDPVGGFQLRLTCACGAALQRFVTTEEAKRPLPLPRAARRPAAPPAPPAERTLAPSPDLDAAMQELLAAEPRPAAAPPATPPPASAPAAAVPSAQPSAPAAPAKLSPDTTTIRAALSQQTAIKRQTPGTPARPAPRTRVVWLVLFAIVAFGAVAALYFAGAPDAPAPAPVASMPARAPLDQRTALNEVASSLRQLQVASSPTASLSDYSTRVSVAKAAVDRFIGSAAPGPERTLVREIMDVHMLAAAAWKARTVDQKDSWEAVGLDPAVEVCQSVKRVVDVATPPANVSRAQARGEAVASAIQLLWECAAAKLASLDRPAAAP